MAKSLETLRKGGVPARLLEGIAEGKTQTINEWAEEFDVFPNRISTACNQLRKLGVHIHPVGTVYGFTVKPKRESLWTL